jgi:hypothetical protein
METIYEKITYIPIRFYDTDSSEDDGGRAPEDKRPPATVEPDFETTSQSPVCLVFDREFERATQVGNLIPFGNADLQRISGTNFLRGTFSDEADIPFRWSQGIYLQRLMHPTNWDNDVPNPPILVDKMCPGLQCHYRLDPLKTHWLSESEPGIPCEFPYFVGNRVDLFSTPSITIRLNWYVSRDLTDTGIRLTIQETGVSFTYIQSFIPAGEKSFHDITFVLPALGTGKGVIGEFYRYKIWIGLLSDSTLNACRLPDGVDPTDSNASAGRGLNWVVTQVVTQMPLGYNFELQLQHRSFLERGYRTKLNSDLTKTTRHIGHATSRTYGATGWSGALSTNRIYSLDTLWKWDTYSQNSDDDIYRRSFWWVFDTDVDLEHNKRFKLPPFIISNRGIPVFGVWSQEMKDAGLNVGLPIEFTYFSDVLTSRHDGVSRYLECTSTDLQGSAVAGMPGLTWFTDRECSSMGKKYMFLPYNSQGMLVLVHRLASDDVTEDSLPVLIHKQAPPYTCLNPYPFQYPNGEMYIKPNTIPDEYII